MNYLDLLPDDLIEIINKKLIELQNKERRKIRKETKRAAKQFKFCEKLLKKAYDKYGKFIKQVEYFIGIGENPHIIILVSMFDIPFKEIFY